jgi:uncharacterized membrane protein
VGRRWRRRLVRWWRPIRWRWRLGELVMRRFLQHLFAPSAGSVFPAASLERIAAAIAAAERRHGGQICFAVESALSWRGLWRGQTARSRAEEVFAQLRVWDTAANNGVLIYLLLAEHRIELVADRGLQIDPAYWGEICVRMAERLRARAHEDAALAAIEAISHLLAASYPRAGDAAATNELPDRPTLL